MKTTQLARTLLLALAATLPFAAQAQQDFPKKPIRIIVAVPAGGAADTLGRIVAEKLQTKWGQPVVVENRAGAGGNIAAEHVFNSPPDGYTLLLSPPGPLAINKSLYKKLSYDPDELVPVSVIAGNPNVLLLNPKVPARTLAELITYAKANPGKLNYASGGAGSTPHLTAELFAQMAGINIVHIPYKGGPPAIADLLGGQVDMMFLGIGSTLAMVQDGKLRMPAVGSDKRHPASPDTPTVAETLPGFVSLSWTGLVAPPKTPPALVAKIQAAIAESLAGNAAQGIKGLDARDLILSTPAEAARFTQEEKARWGKVIRATNITID